MTTLLDDLERLAAKVAEARARLRDEISGLEPVGERLTEALSSVEEGWSGSNLGYHADLYFEDFARPSLAQRFDPEWGGIHGLPEGWRDRNLAEVQSVVEERAGTAIESYSEAAKRYAAEVQEVVSEVIIVVAPVRGMAGLEPEAELLESLERADLEPSVPFSVPGAMSRDSTAIAQGQRVAPHQQLRQRVRRAARSLQACSETLALADRLCRQVAARLRQQIEPSTPTTKAEAAAVTVVGMLRRFEDAARALRGRQRGRDDFTIADEYDVQDLVHAILRLHFDDVRPEEWTPSYAGGSSRIDFLLKREDVVVEVKMTRSGLGDREVGEQLAIDIVRYRAHPNADVLVCFVHDPEHRIQNPRGIEDDLAELSDPELQVVVLIA